MTTTLKTKFAICLVLTAVVRTLLTIRENGYLEEKELVPIIVKGIKEEKKLNYFTGDKRFCFLLSNWHHRLPPTNAVSPYDDWTFTTKSKCPYLTISDTKKNKWIQILSLSCSGGVSRLVPSWTNTTRGIASVEFGDPCLGEYIRTCCSDGKPVPNVVHYVWYNDKELDFFDFVSFISVIKFARPCLILIHGEYVPRGKYWDYVIERSPNIIHVRRSRPETIFGKKIGFEPNSGDVMRIEALLKYGGIYLDTDTILVRSIGKLRKYDCTMSLQRAGFTLGSAFIMAKEDSIFIQYWYNGYRDDFNSSHYFYNAMLVPYNLSKKFPHLIHVENYTLSRPKGHKLFDPFISNYNWSDLYGMHVYKRMYKEKFTDMYNLPPLMSETVIRSLNSTIGSMIRYILYGIKEVCNS